MYYEEKVKDILDDESLSKEEKIKQINEYFDKQYEEINDELRNYLIKIWGGFALEVGSAAIPGAGVGKLGTKVVAKRVGKEGLEKLGKSLGRKLSKDLVPSVTSGVLSGTIVGAGDALSKDKDFSGIIGEAAEGLLGGAAVGGIAVYAEKFLRGVKIKSYGDLDKLAQKIRNKYFKDVKEYYKDYIQEREFDLNGKIKFTNKAPQEQLKWNPHQAKNYPELIKDLKNAKWLRDEPNIKPEQKPDVSHYEVYQGKYGLHKIEVFKDGYRRYYFTENLPNTGMDVNNSQYLQLPKNQGTIRSANHTASMDRPSGTTDIAVDTPQQAHNPVYNEVYPPRALVEASDKIINDFSENVNSPDGSTMLKGHVEVNVPKDETLSDIEQGNPTGYAAKISEKTQAEGQKDDDNLPTWEKPLEGYEKPNVYYDGKKYTFDGELSDEVISKMNIHEKIEYYTKYLKHYYVKRLKTLAKEQEQRDRLEIIRQQEIQRQKEFEEEYWSPEEIREEVEEYLSWVFTQTARTMGYL